MSRRRRSNRSIQRSPGGVNTGSEIRTTEFLDIVTDEAIIRRALNKSRLLAMFRKDDVEATLAQMRSEGEIVVDHDKIFLIKEEIN